MPALWLDAVSNDRIDWPLLEQNFSHYRAMSSCIQDPIHHGEGDVWTHTRMVDAATNEFGLSGLLARLTALFHDVEKPSTREIVDGRISHPRHARKGAQTAWFELWLAGVPADLRLAVYGLILWHQRVFHMWEYSDMDHLVQTFGAIGRWDDLIAFGRADNVGRICADPARGEDDLRLLDEYVAENLVQMDDASRFQYLRREQRSKLYVEREPVGSRLTMLCGLPGSGKDTWIRNHHAGKTVISLDAIRREQKVEWTDDQTSVVVEAYERAKELFRRREPFVWNATSLTRLYRGKLIALAADYDAHVSIEVIDRPAEVIFKQDAGRPIKEQVSKDIILELAQRWEPPTLLEAHCINWV